MMARPASRGGGHAGRALLTGRQQLNSELARTLRRAEGRATVFCGPAIAGRGSSPSPHALSAGVNSEPRGAVRPRRGKAGAGLTNRHPTRASNSSVVQQALQRRHGRPVAVEVTNGTRARRRYGSLDRQPIPFQCQRRGLRTSSSLALTAASHIARVSGGQSRNEPRDHIRKRLHPNVTRHRIPLRITAAAATPGKVARFGSDGTAPPLVAQSNGREASACASHTRGQR